MSGIGETASEMGKRKAFTPEQEADVCSRFGSGESVRSISESYGRCGYTVRSVLHKYGISTPRYRQLDVEIDVDEAARLYKDGSTLHEIASMMGCSWMTIQRRLTDAGVDMHAQGCRYVDPMTTADKRLSENKQAQKRRNAISKRPHDGGSRGIRWGDIARRDHMRCQICGRMVDASDKWKSAGGRWCFGRAYPTVDHIIALYNGGTDTYDNVQLACKHCNSKKGHKGQMRLAI